MFVTHRAHGDSLSGVLECASQRIGLHLEPGLSPTLGKPPNLAAGGNRRFIVEVNLRRMVDRPYRRRQYTDATMRVVRVSEQLECGKVCSNSGVFATEAAPFGGGKESEIGSECGAEGIAEFHQTKFHSIGRIENAPMRKF